MTFLDKIDFCIKTYKRPVALARLIASIERFYPSASVTVNADPCIAAGRNAMVDATERPFLLMLDDDFEFTEETDIERLWKAIKDAPAYIAAGAVLDHIDGQRVPRNSGGMLRMKRNAVYLDKALGHMGLVDVVPNFLLARRSVFQYAEYRWGIGAEHLDLFMQLYRKKLAIYQEPAVTIDHHPFTEAEPGYKAERWNVADNQLRFADYWGIDRVIVNGTVSWKRETVTA